MKQTVTQPETISLAFLFANLAQAIEVYERPAPEKSPRKPPEDLTALRADVVTWLKQARKATYQELADKFQVSPRKMRIVFGVLAKKKIVQRLDESRNPVWVLA